MKSIFFSFSISFYNFSYHLKINIIYVYSANIIIFLWMVIFLLNLSRQERTDRERKRERCIETLSFYKEMLAFDRAHWIHVATVLTLLLGFLFKWRWVPTNMDVTTNQTNSCPCIVAVTWKRETEDLYNDITLKILIQFLNEFLQ